MSVRDIENAVIKKHPMVFRNDNGCAFVGELFKNSKGELFLRHPKRITYGLMKGSGDHIGWTTIKITDEMVGQKLAIFTSIEDKTVNDKLSVDQRRWNKAVRKDGGISEVWKETKNGEITILKGAEIE